MPVGPETVVCYLRYMNALFARVRHADEYISKLQTALLALDKEKDKYIKIEPQHDSTNMHFNFTGYLLSDPPHELSFISGDAIHNLRAALDNLTWALAEKYGTPNTKRNVQFVACKAQIEFDDAKKRFRLQEIGVPALQILERLQPFHQQTPTEAPLYILTELDNRHKHRDLVAFEATARMGDKLIAIDMPGVAAPVAGDWALAGFSSPNPVLLTKAGAVIFSVDFAGPTPHIGFHMEFHVALCLTGAGPLSKLGVMQSLPKLRDEVSETLKMFQHLL
jgi:hypothetical protein